MVLHAAKRRSLVEGASPVEEAPDRSLLDTAHLPSGKSTPSDVTHDPERPPSGTPGNSGTTSGATSTSAALPTGVYSRPGGTWSAWLTLGREQHYLGAFDDIGQATVALTDAKSAAISKDVAAKEYLIAVILSKVKMEKVLFLFSAYSFCLFFKRMIDNSWVGKTY